MEIDFDCLCDLRITQHRLNVVVATGIPNFHSDHSRAIFLDLILLSLSFSTISIDLAVRSTRLCPPRTLVHAIESSTSLIRSGINKMEGKCRHFRSTNKREDVDYTSTNTMQAMVHQWHDMAQHLHYLTNAQ